MSYVDTIGGGFLVKNAIYGNELFFDNDFDVYKIEKELNIKPSDCKRRNETRMSPFDKNKHCELFGCSY